MAKLESESAIELLMEHSGMSEDQARDVVLQRIQDDKDNEPPKEPKEKRQKFLLVADPKGVIPESLLAYVATCHPTPFIEGTYILDMNTSRNWGLSEAATIYERTKYRIQQEDTDDIADSLTNLAGNKRLKKYGLTINKEPMLIVPVDTKTITKYFPDYVTEVEVSCSEDE